MIFRMPGLVHYYFDDYPKATAAVTKAFDLFDEDHIDAQSQFFTLLDELDSGGCVFQRALQVSCWDAD